MHAIKKARRNPGSFQPNWLPAGVVNSWFNPNFGVTLVGGKVSSWVDQVNGHAMVQTNAGNRPVFNATGGGVGGNLPYLQGDGIATFLQGAWALVQPEQIFMLAGVWTTLAGSVFDGGVAGNTGRLFQTGTLNVINIGASATPITGDFTALPGGIAAWHTYNVLFRSGSLANMLVGQLASGVLGNMPGDAGALNMAGMTLFGSGFSTGAVVADPANIRVSEIIITTGATASQQNQIVQYLAAKGNCT
jgi:hypothetical protein